PELTRGTYGEAAGVGPAPKCRRSAFSEETERNSLGVLCRLSEFVLGGTGTRRARSEAEDRVPLGDGNAPNRCTRKGGNRNGKTGMKRSCQSETPLALRAANRRQSPLFAGSQRTTRRLANAPMENRFSGSQERLLSGDLSSAQ